MIRALALTLAAAATPVAALDPPAGATLTLSEASPLDSLRVATGPFAGGLPAVTTEGAVTRRVWSVADPGTTLALLRPLREALLAEGWEVAFECAARDCGGFEFRFEIDVAPAPEMFVDLSDYRYLAARRGEAWTELVVSRSGAVGYVQATEVAPAPSAASPASPSGEAGAPAVPLASDRADTPAGPSAPPADAKGAAVQPAPDRVDAPEGPPPPMPADAGDVAGGLERVGRAVLADLDFASGSTALPGEEYPSLAALAAFMAANQDVTVALVGHTDSVGSAEGNLAVSLARARSARDLLVRRHGVAAGRVEAWGVGFYAPLGTNATEAGRRANRRVEAVVISTP